MPWISIGALLAVAFKVSDNNAASNSMMTTSAQMAPTSQPIENVKLVVKSDEEHARMGPEGTWHDAFLPADFSVKAGAVVKVTVYNYDEGEHSFTAPGLGANVAIAAGSKSKPAVTTFTIHAPAKAGLYEWLCAIPCDPWAMNQNGYMRGNVRVV
ncbi:MAG: cupredoxin domain-containing protein [Solirubrobacterales bacterium]|nr:cupredoxin domain-containing protein [Solirubrobacterales bacterium]